MWFTKKQSTPIDWDSLETGDILLFHGERFWFSYVVEWFTWSEFSHIGIVLRDPTNIKPELKGLYMLESGTELFPDAVEHRIHYGVQIVNLEKVINSYCGKVYKRKLSIPKTFRENMCTVLVRIWDKIMDLPYDDKVWDLIRVTFNLDWGDNNRYDHFFCSALVAFLYEQFGFFKEPISWDLILPKDFDDNGRIITFLVENVNLDKKCLIYST